MEREQLILVKDAVHKLQLGLLEGIHNENQLFAAGSLISRSDYEDVVTERSISNLCGYPLCSNSLPSERPRKGRYRISLKEHKVYDLHETYMYCSSGCVVSSRAFAGILQDERCSTLSSSKINEILKLFGKLGLEDKGLGKKADLGLSDLKIEEKLNEKIGNMLAEDWIGPSNAIEGYVPLRDRSSKVLPLKDSKEGSQSETARPKKGKGKIANGMDFKSTTIVRDQFNTPKTTTVHELNSEESKANEFVILEASLPMQSSPRTELDEMEVQMSNLVIETQYTDPGMTSSPSKNASGDGRTGIETNGEVCTVKMTESNELTMKSSMKSLGPKKLTRSVTWADKRQSDAATLGSLCDYQEMGDTYESTESSRSSNVEDVDRSLRFASAEACANALIQAAESVASGEADINDAVSGAGITIMSQPQHFDGGNTQEDENEMEPEMAPVKWPMKHGSLPLESFDIEDSWYDAPPDGFSLEASFLSQIWLSSFATMWMALFGWITSSSLAYIYGREESSREEFLLVNGREYPHKIVLSDGRSSEIKQTLAGCLSRALPGVVRDLRLPTPISSLEQGMSRLLETMTFIDALPAFRMKQWHVIALLFIDALSVYRIPGLTPHMTSTRMLIHKVVDGAQLSTEEYDVMKDLIIPLGRLPQFSAQSGG